MELSAVASEGLTLCGDTARVGDRSFRCLVMSACDILLKRKDEDVLHDNDELSSVDAAVLKQSYAGIVTLALEAAKTNSDTPQISSLLEDCKWGSERINYFTSLYEEIKPELEAELSSIGSSFPHIVDVDWRLDYYIKNNHMEKVNQPTYLITLKTEETNKSKGKDIQFSCSMEQLQDLVGKLRDACKTMERVANM
ncbi:COMM domain-containing protein 3 [Nematostella vectensis]|uniref:COMM domain-containing protein 3 n=1 Tax=Nematostella vectensis TaxID=45351 RepID=UPI002076EC2E|nr:COMM domain-containing protein 3 [Nematostella vectensis]